MSNQPISNSLNITRIGIYREKLEADDPELAKRFPRMIDSFSIDPVPRKEMLCYFIRRAGYLDIATGANAKDVFTGEDTGIESSSRCDGVYSWGADLAWYVDKYNLVLPEDFVEHALSWPRRKKEAGRTREESTRQLR